jgi:NADH:ubiquinone oxidoreductase subunit E
LEIPPREVFEAASFYTLFRRKDMGCFRLQVCNNITCAMMGSEKILEVIEEELGITQGDVTSDRLFSLLHVQCLGSCGTAPVVQINEEYFELMTPEKMRATIRKLRESRSLEALQRECPL